jgi:hypothetical protein
MIKVPDVPDRRRDRKVCRWCEASPQACRSNEWLRGRRCCDACTGNHDEETNPAEHRCAGCGRALGIVPRRWCPTCADDEERAEDLVDQEAEQ